MGIMKKYAWAIFYFMVLGLYLLYPDNNVAWLLNFSLNFIYTGIFIGCAGFMIYTNSKFEDNKKSRIDFIKAIDKPEVTSWKASVRFFFSILFNLGFLVFFFYYQMVINFFCFFFLLVVYLIALFLRKKSLKLLYASKVMNNEG
jgi:hypothetical protein